MPTKTTHTIRHTLIVLIAFAGGIITTILASMLYAATSQSLADSLLSKIEDKVGTYSTAEKLAYFTSLHADIPAMIAALTAVDAKLVEKIDTIKTINDASSSTLGDLVDSAGTTNNTTSTDKMVTIVVRDSGWACGNPDPKSNDFTTYSQSYLADGTVKVNVTYCLTKGNYIWSSCPSGRHNMTLLTELTEGKNLICPAISNTSGTNNTTAGSTTNNTTSTDKMVTIVVRDSGWACGNPDPKSNDFTTYSQSYLADGTVKVNVTYCLTKGYSVWTNCRNGTKNSTLLNTLTEGKDLTCPSANSVGNLGNDVYRPSENTITVIPEPIGVQSSQLTDVDFKFERINTATGQYLKLIKSDNVNRVLYTATGITLDGSTATGSSNDVNINRYSINPNNTLFTPWNVLHTNRWPAGTYTNTWTVILFNGSPKTFTETFIIK